jgi:hypothetical protein
MVSFYIFLKLLHPNANQRKIHWTNLKPESERKQRKKFSASAKPRHKRGMRQNGTHCWPLANPKTSLYLQLTVVTNTNDYCKNIKVLLNKPALLLLIHSADRPRRFYHSHILFCLLKYSLTN